ncbi:hypothetical protein MTR67_034246 [Solanum verrucosum]|uniref:Uncharacterized protein n=1 Tax=Solanum verrucosum TaxID=315347 RepID=A0AAF0ZIF7_SOLVR|nr:hypothetical protein MTR67_034246 [Solanum verrucosum]
MSMLHSAKALVKMELPTSAVPSTDHSYLLFQLANVQCLPEPHGQPHGQRDEPHNYTSVPNYSEVYEVSRVKTLDMNSGEIPIAKPLSETSDSKVIRIYVLYCKTLFLLQVPPDKCPWDLSTIPMKMLQSFEDIIVGKPQLLHFNLSLPRLSILHGKAEENHGGGRRRRPAE